MEAQRESRKQTTREAALAQRRRLVDAHQRDWSRTIAQSVITLPEFQPAHHIALYAELAGEVRTDQLFTEAIARGKQVFYPRLDITTNTLHFYRVQHLRELQPAYRGIREPRHGKISRATYDLIIVPGVAFDPHGGRLGRGGGHYDAWLGIAQGCRVGLAYECQIVDEVPMDAHDQRMHIIVTEQRVIRCQHSM